MKLAGGTFSKFLFTRVFPLQPRSNSCSQWFLYSSLVLPVTTARYLSLHCVNSKEFAFRLEYFESI